MRLFPISNLIGKMYNKLNRRVRARYRLKVKVVIVTLSNIA